MIATRTLTLETFTCFIFKTISQDRSYHPPCRDEDIEGQTSPAIHPGPDSTMQDPMLLPLPWGYTVWDRHTEMARAQIQPSGSWGPRAMREGEFHEERNLFDLIPSTLLSTWITIVLLSELVKD